MKLVRLRMRHGLLFLLSLVFSQHVFAVNDNNKSEDMLFQSMMNNCDQRQVTSCFYQLDKLISTHPEQVYLYQVGLIMGAKFDDYAMIFDSANAILQRKPNNLQALYFKTIYSRAFLNDDYVHWRNAIASLQPALARQLDKIVERVEDIWQKPVPHSLYNMDAKGVGIIALGSPAAEDGTPQPRLLNTLIRTLALSKAYPDAPIFVTGAAVYTNMSESAAMQHWLISKGVDARRIIVEDKAKDTIGNAMNIFPILERESIDKLLLVTVSYHMRRAYLIIDGIFQQQMKNFTLLSVPADSNLSGKALTQRLHLEKVSSYRDLSRAYGLYDVQGFHQ